MKIHIPFCISGIYVESTKRDYGSIPFSPILIWNTYVYVTRIFGLSECFFPTDKQIIIDPHSGIRVNFDSFFLAITPSKSFGTKFRQSSETSYTFSGIIIGSWYRGTRGS